MPRRPISDYRKGQLQVVTAALLWSTGGLLVRLIEADDWTIIFWRSVFAVAFLVTFALIRDGARIWAAFRQLGWPGLLASVCFAADTILFVFALNRTSVANVLIMFSTAPFWAALLAWVVLRERVPLRTLLAMIAAVAGITIMVSGSLGARSLTGDAMALLISILFAVPVVTIRRYPEIRMLPAVILAALMTASVAAAFAVIAHNTPADLGLMAAFGIVEYGIALVLFTAGARYVPVAQTMLIGLLETVLGPVWVWLVVAEDPGFRTLAGGAIVLTALLLYAVYDLRAMSRQPAPVV